MSTGDRVPANEQPDKTNCEDNALEVVPAETPHPKPSVHERNMGSRRTHGVRTRAPKNAPGVHCAPCRTLSHRLTSFAKDSEASDLMSSSLDYLRLSYDMRDLPGDRRKFACHANDDPQTCDGLMTNL